MTIDRYLLDLGGALQVRGATRRRFLRECRDHLADAAAERGADEAVRAFGPPSEVAAAFDAEVAARRGVRSTFVTVAGVLATGGSTLALIHAASPGAAAAVVWAVAFFVAAQVAAVAAGLALVQALVLRRSAMSPAEIVLLARRNRCALVAAGVTMFSAGAALPGHGSVVGLVAGPALACIALVAVLRTRSLARRLDRSGTLAVRPPLTDLGAARPPPGPLPRQPPPAAAHHVPGRRRGLPARPCRAGNRERGVRHRRHRVSWCSARRSASGAADGRAPASAEPRWVREEAVERSAAPSRRLRPAAACPARSRSCAGRRNGRRDGCCGRGGGRRGRPRGGDAPAVRVRAAPGAGAALVPGHHEEAVRAEPASTTAGAEPDRKRSPAATSQSWVS